MLVVAVGPVPIGPMDDGPVDDGLVAVGPMAVGPVAGVVFASVVGFWGRAKEPARQRARVVVDDGAHHLRGDGFDAANAVEERHEPPVPGAPAEPAAAFGLGPHEISRSYQGKGPLHEGEHHPLGETGQGQRGLGIKLPQLDVGIRELVGAQFAGEETKGLGHGRPTRLGIEEQAPLDHFGQERRDPRVAFPGTHVALLLDGGEQLVTGVADERGDAGEELIEPTAKHIDVRLGGYGFATELLRGPALEIVEILERGAVEIHARAGRGRGGLVLGRVLVDLVGAAEDLRLELLFVGLLFVALLVVALFFVALFGVELDDGRQAG